jgi:predicted adenylyl cyclase CyaB
MQNIEVKARMADRGRIEKQLTALGARRMWVRRQRDTFFRVPPPASGRSWLKLREVEGRRPEIISYWRPEGREGPRASDYDVMVLEEVGNWKRLLGRVLPEDIVVAKERTLWLYENTRIHLDRVEGLGDFVEIETVVRDLRIDVAREETLRLMDVLHLAPEDSIEGAYRDLLAAR